MWAALATCALGLLSSACGTVVVYSQGIPRIVVDEFTDQPAAFGEKIPDDGLRGFLVVGDPEDGCTSLAKPPPADNFTDKWIVLLARYNCSFDVKIRNAQNAGYDCAIVHNVNSSELDTMTTKTPEGITIPSVFVGDKSGRRLAENYIFTYGYYIMVDGAPYDINTQFLLPFAILVALCLLIMIILMIVKCIRDRRHARRRMLPSRVLKKIPTCKFSKGDPYDTCAICLDDYVEGDRLRVLPCAHAYHSKCIDPWLTQSRRVCPVCKRRVSTAGERRVSCDSASSDDSREPLIRGRAPTSGGTFEPQRENPFVRAGFFVGWNTRATETNETREESEESENGQQHDENDINTNEETQENDRQPMIWRRSRFFRRLQNWREASAAAATAAAAAESPPAGAESVPALHAEPSINTESRGEIGVAALPAAQTTPRHVNL